MKKLLTFLTLLTLSIGVTWAADRWVKTAPSDLATGDIVVIANNSEKHAMSNDNGTSTAPSAIEYSLTNGEISSTVTDNMQWVVTKDGNNFKFQVNGTSNYLYCTNTNNGVRVGTNSNNVFTITKDNTNHSSYQQLKNTATSRYVGEYTQGPDWRCYTSATQSNIIECNTILYKKVSDDTPTPTTYNVNIGSMTNGNVTASETSNLEEGDVVTLTISPNSGYELSTLTVDNTDVTSSVSNNQYTFQMPDHNVDVSASFIEQSITPSSNAMIVFGDNGSDATADVTSATLLEYTISGASYVSSYSDISKVYKAITGIKFSSSKVGGNLTINLSSLAQQPLSKIIVKAKKYGTDDASLSVDGTSTGSLTAEYADYEITCDGTAKTSITLEATARLYVKSINLVFEEQGEYTITSEASPATAGTVNCKSSSDADKTVEFTITTNDNYEFEYVEVKDANDATVEVTESNGTYSFTMPESNVTITAHFNQAGSLYILGQVNGNDASNWDPNKGVKMNYSNGVYTANVFVSATNGGYFSFRNVLANWGNGYDASRWGSESDNWLFSEGQPNGNANIVNGSEKSFHLPNGIYTFTVNINNRTLVVTKVENATASISPNGGDVKVGTTATITESGLATFLSSCQPVVNNSNTTITDGITVPQVKIYNSTDAGDNKTYTEGSTYGLNTGGDVTLYAKAAILANNIELATALKSATFHVKYAIATAEGISGGSIGNITPSSKLANEGDEVSFNVNPNGGYNIASVTVTTDGGQTVTATAGENNTYTFTMPADNVTINATFTAVNYTITLVNDNTKGTATLSATSANAGNTITVTVQPNEGYSVTGITVTKAEGGTINATPGENGTYTFTMQASNVTVTVNYKEAYKEKKYQLITSEDDLEAGATYLVVGIETEGTFVMSKSIKGTNNARADRVATTPENEIITSTEDMAVITLGGATYDWTLLTDNGYIGSGSNMFNSSEKKASISFNEDNNVIITQNGKELRYNSSSDWFQFYDSSSGTAKPYLYKEVGISDPKFSIPAGIFQNSDYPNGINVALTCATDGATIYYSTDGTNFSEYSSAINVTETTTIYAYATKDGKQSNTVSANYKFVDFLVSDVVFSPASGTYYGDQTCQMFSTSKGARIYYTTDGSEPVMNQGTTQLYTGEVDMPATGTYNFKAVAYIGTTPSEISTASYVISNTTDYVSPSQYNNPKLYSVAELNAVEVPTTEPYYTTSYYEMVNPVQVIYMSTYKQNGYQPEFCLVRDNTGYGMIYFGKQNSSHNNYTVFEMGDWIGGGYSGQVSNFYDPNQQVLSDTHPELGRSGSGTHIYNWVDEAMSNSAVLPEYLTIPEIKASDPTGAGNDYWGHYVHLRKSTIELVQSEDPGNYTTGQDKDGKWSGTITDENGQSIMYYDKFYLQIDKDWTTTSNDFTGHPNRTFDVYGFVACYKNVYQISPFAFAWIDKPVIDKETAIYYEPQTVTLSSPEDPTATIWYKTDDMDDYAVYTEPFEVNSTTTVEWYATKQSQYNDELESLRGSITMTFDEIAKPVITPESQVKAVGESVDARIAYEEGKTVPPIAVILYTTDGSDPKTSETAQEYTLGTTLTFTTTTTVRAITRVGNLYSAEADAKTYTFVKSNGIEYTLIDDVTKLKENGVYVIVSQNYSEAISTTQNVNNRGAAGVLFVEGTNKAKVYGNDDVAQFTLSVLTHDEDTSPERHFLMQTNNSNVNGYLYVGHDVNNSLMTEAEEDAMGNDVAVITIDSDCRAHIHFNYAGGDNRYLQYWNRDRLFNTYKSEYDDRAVYIYGVEATPLATIEKEGKSGQDYTVADELVGVYFDQSHPYLLWCKDQGNVSIAKSNLAEGEIDFLHDVVDQNKFAAWEDCDQSNWVILDFSGVTGVHNDPEEFLGKYIAPASITGTYTKDTNYKIALKQAPTLNEGSASYTNNVYVATNFVATYQNPGYNGRRVLNPKGTEVHTITYAVWNGSGFSTPETTDMPGSITVDWTYNANPDIAEDLIVNSIYEFTATVGLASTTPSGVPGLKVKEPIPATGYVLQPLDLSTDKEMDPTTGISGITNGKAVKSIKYVNVAGIVSDVPFQGVNIVVTEYTDGSRTTSKMLRK